MASKNDMRAFVSSFADGLDDKAFALATLQAMIAAEISMRRQELNLSQKELAAMLGVSQGLVSRWEKGCKFYAFYPCGDCFRPQS